MTRLVGIGIVLALTAGAGSAGLLAQSGTVQPVARYEMRAQTISGGDAPPVYEQIVAAGPDQCPGIGVPLGRGLCLRAQRLLSLELGSERAPTDGPPHAEHAMPAGMGFDAPVRLNQFEALYPFMRDKISEEMTARQRRAHVQLFWGCGEHAGAGQPLVMDFDQRGAPTPLGVFDPPQPAGRLASAATSRTFGHWFSIDRKAYLVNGALVGHHRVTGNYIPDMAFDVSHDFMGVLQASTKVLPGGGLSIEWNRLPEATGYQVVALGAKPIPGEIALGRDFVWWTASPTRRVGDRVSDWLAPPAVAQMVAAGALLAPGQTRCTMPSEVKAALGAFPTVRIIAFGPEEGIAFPPRPAGHQGPWKPEWIVRIRHRATTAVTPGYPGLGVDDIPRLKAAICKRQAGNAQGAGSRIGC